MRKPVVVLLEGEDGTAADLAGRLRSRGLPVLDVLPPGMTAEATCARVLRWYAALPGDLAGAARAECRVLIGSSAALAAVRAEIARVAASDANVLVTGETGTGKELVAELLHAASGRTGPLVPINCAAIPDGLLESELFGYERGAFTGASASYEGKLRLAHGGTVLLDEIGDMSPYAQAKLLRAIETREVFRLGGRRAVPLDVRILAATNADLESLVAAGRFRSDLYFRVNVARIHIPPLRERTEDVPLLVEHCLAERARRSGGAARGISAEALACLCRYPWPGNVRELNNVVQVMTLESTGRELGLDDLPPAVRAAGRPAAEPRSAPAADEERDRLLAALRTTHWNKSRAAQQLRWSRMTVYRKMAKYHIDEAGAGAHPAPNTPAVRHGTRP